MGIARERFKNVYTKFAENPITYRQFVVQFDSWGNESEGKQYIDYELLAIRIPDKNYKGQQRQDGIVELQGGYFLLLTEYTEALGMDIKELKAGDLIIYENIKHEVLSVNEVGNASGNKYVLLKVPYRIPIE